MNLTLETKSTQWHPLYQIVFLWKETYLWVKKIIICVEKELGGSHIEKVYKTGHFDFSAWIIKIWSRTEPHYKAMLWVLKLLFKTKARGFKLNPNIQWNGKYNKFEFEIEERRILILQKTSRRGEVFVDMQLMKMELHIQERANCRSFWLQFWQNQKVYLQLSLQRIRYLAWGSMKALISKWRNQYIFLWITEEQLTYLVVGVWVETQGVKNMLFMLLS